MLDDPRVDQFVGPNAAYYRENWQRFIDEPDKKLSFNLAAFFGNAIWLAYRRLYKPLFWLTLICIIHVALFLYAEERQLVSSSVLDYWGWMSGMLLMLVVGSLGNYWYWKEFLKTPAGPAAGGTSRLAAGIVVFVLVAPIAWALYWAAPVLMPDMVSEDRAFVFGRTGPLTLDEVQTNFINKMDDDMVEARLNCVLGEVEARAAAAGDPETLDPSTVEFLPEENWDALDADGKRLILSQAIVTKSFFECPRRNF